MNKSPQYQNKHRDQESCHPFPQQVQADFGLPLRVTVVAVIPASVPGTVVILRCITLRPEGFYSPDSGVALHFWASGTSAASVAVRRRCFFFFFFCCPHLHLLLPGPTDRAEGQTSSEKKKKGGVRFKNAEREKKGGGGGLTHWRKSLRRN